MIIKKTLAMSARPELTPEPDSTVDEKKKKRH
jgi:hypothetical protein